MSTVLTSTPSLNHLSSSLILTSFVLFCLFLIKPLSAKVQSSRPYDLHHWPVLSCHSYQNWTAICRDMSIKNHQNFEVGRRVTLFSMKAKSSFLSRYPFSIDHFSVRNFSIASRPWKNWSRLRQIESGVYASCQKECQRGHASIMIFELVSCAILEARVSGCT